MRPVPEPALALIKRWETLRISPYLDAVGIPTIGYGAIHDERGQPVTLAHPAISEEIARSLLERDVSGASRSVERLCPVRTTDGQFGALCSFVFNLGAGALQRSCLRQRLLRGDYQVSEEFLKWNKAGGRILAGLTARRQSEAALFAQG